MSLGYSSLYSTVKYISDMEIVQGVVSEVDHEMWQLTVDRVTQAKITCPGKTAEVRSRNWAATQYYYYYYYYYLI
jgi:hypothetical protein